MNRTIENGTLTRISRGHSEQLKENKENPYTRVEDLFRDGPALWVCDNVTLGWQLVTGVKHAEGQGRLTLSLSRGAYSLIELRKLHAVWTNDVTTPTDEGNKF